MNVRDIMAEESSAIVKELVEKYDSLGMRATGQWERRLQTFIAWQEGKIIAKIVGEDYTYYMQHGRKDGKLPPIRAIEAWIQAKGIQPIEKKMKISSLAFAIAHKIGQMGTRRFQNNGKPEFIDDVITPERIQSIIDKVGEGYIIQFSSDIIKIIEEIQNVA